MSAAISVSAGESAAHVFKKERNVSAALNFGKERRVSGAHKNDERTKGLVLNLFRFGTINFSSSRFKGNLNLIDVDCYSARQKVSSAQLSAHFRKYVSRTARIL